MSSSVKVALLCGSLGLLASCGKNLDTSSKVKFRDIFSGTNFYYLDKNDRVALVSEVYNQVKRNYSLWGVKKARLGIDGDKVFSDAIEAEKAIDDASNTEMDQAKSNLAVLDRLKKTIATFQDTHFAYHTASPRKFVLNGITVAEVDKKIIITAKSDAILGYAKLKAREPNLFDAISIGDTIISIDNEPVENNIQKLLPYINGSSPEYAREEAVSALSLRNFLYPSAGQSEWEIQSRLLGKTIKIVLPYYMNGKTARLDSTVYLENLGIKSLDELKARWDAVRKKWVLENPLAFTGYAAFSPPKGIKDEKVYENPDDNSITLRTGLLVRKGKTYSYMQLKDYSAESLVLKGGTNKKDFLDVIREFVKESQENETPLIFDLRENNGGNGSYPAKILSILGRYGEKYPARTKSFRVTPQIRQLTEHMGDGTPSPGGFDLDLNTYDIIKKAIKERHEYTDVIAVDPFISADPEIGGYENKIVVLISPDCVSACDAQAMLFKASGRAKLIGTHANGTGAGFISDGSLGNKEWEDSFQISRLVIPNYLFGISGKEGQTVFSEPDAYLKYNSENVPAQADIQYNSTKFDYFVLSSGWMQKAMDVLDAP